MWTRVAAIAASVVAIVVSVPSRSSVRSPHRRSAVSEIAAANFDDGTPGPFGVTGVVSFPDDPTRSGHGRVADMRYTASATPVEVRSALVYHPTQRMGFGSTFFFSGELFFPDETYNLANPNVDRALLTYSASVSDSGAPELTVVLHLYGCGFLFFWSENRAGSRCHLGPIQPSRWVRIETQVTMNSAMAAHDGIVRLWVDGALVATDTDVLMTNPTWTHEPVWHEWAIGAKRRSADWNGLADISEGGSIDERRYWDNVVFSTSRVGTKASSR